MSVYQREVWDVNGVTIGGLGEEKGGDGRQIDGRRSFTELFGHIDEVGRMGGASPPNKKREERRELWELGSPIILSL